MLVVRSPRSLRSRRHLATAAVAALASAALVVPAQAAPPSSVLTSEAHQQIQIAQAARDAGVRAKLTPPGRSSEATRAMDAGLVAMVSDGAIGATGRLSTPTIDWRASAGRRDLDRGNAPAGFQDRFRTASITKPMVATLVLQEVEAGVWTLDTRANDIIPGLFPGHDVTLRQLLSHTGGVPNGTFELLASQISDWDSFDQFSAAISRDYTAQDHIDLVNAVPWTQPGAFLYSNAGYVALGMLLEAQTGRPVGDLLRDRVWRPAGMKHTSYPDEPGLRGPVLQEDAWIGTEYSSTGWFDLAGFDPDFFLSAGAVVTATEDLNAFTRALVTGQLVAPALVEEMITPVSSEFLEYGLGIYRVPDPCAAPGTAYLYGHDGASYGTLTISLTSLDGTRQLSLTGTGRDLSSAQGRWSLNEALVPMLLASCPA